MTQEAAGDSEPTTTKQIRTAQRTMSTVRRVSGGRPNRGVSLFCCRNMLPFNGAGIHRFQTAEARCFASAARPTRASRRAHLVDHVDLVFQREAARTGQTDSVAAQIFRHLATVAR